MQTSAERAALDAGCVQVIEPARGRVEMRWVALAVVVTIVLSALAVAWQRHQQHTVELASYQLDLAQDLSAAEQGIYTDLQAIYDEWVATGAKLPPPASAFWADEGWPPFADAQANTNRVARQWQLLEVAERWAYVGAAPEGGRAIAWVLPPKDEDGDGDGAGARFEVWLSQAEASAQALPRRLETTTLAAAGWRQVTAHVRDAAAAGAADPHAGHGH